MSKHKTPSASQQKTLQKINSLAKQVDDFTEECIKSVNFNHGKIRVLEMVLESMLESQVKEHNFEDFEEAVFNKEYGFLFSNLFMHVESKEIIKVNFPEQEQEQEEEEPELEDELLDDSK